MSNLRNPYQYSQSPQNQPPQYLMAEQNQENYDYYNQDYLQNIDYDNEDIYSQPSPSFKYFGEKGMIEDDARSETIARKPKESNISGVHEKYLKSLHQSNEKQSFRSQRKFHTAKPLVTKFKKSTVQTEQMARLANTNPIFDGLLALQIDSQKLKDEISVKSQSGEEQKASIFRQLGLKQPKVLGKAKTERELQILSTFLGSGEMPSDYINDFLLLIST